MRFAVSERFFSCLAKNAGSERQGFLTSFVLSPVFTYSAGSVHFARPAPLRSVGSNPWRIGKSTAMCH